MRSACRGLWGCGGRQDRGRGLGHLGWPSTGTQFTPMLGPPSPANSKLWVYFTQGPPSSPGRDSCLLLDPTPFKPTLPDGWVLSPQSGPLAVASGAWLSHEPPCRPVATRPTDGRGGGLKPQCKPLTLKHLDARPPPPTPPAGILRPCCHKTPARDSEAGQGRALGPAGVTPAAGHLAGPDQGSQLWRPLPGPRLPACRRRAALPPPPLCGHSRTRTPRSRPLRPRGKRGTEEEGDARQPLSPEPRAGSPPGAPTPIPARPGARGSGAGVGVAGGWDLRAPGAPAAASPHPAGSGLGVPAGGSRARSPSGLSLWGAAARPGRGGPRGAGEWPRSPRLD